MLQVQLWQVTCNVVDPNEVKESEEDSPPEAEAVDSSESEDESEDEDKLHGPCGGKVCGADPPPKPLRTYLGQFVAKLFQVDNQEDNRMFWGEVVRYEPSAKKFAVRYLFIYFTIIIYLFNLTQSNVHAGQVQRRHHAKIQSNRTGVNAGFF